VQGFVGCSFLSDDQRNHVSKYLVAPGSLELYRKEKALTETAALLVLRKKE